MKWHFKLLLIISLLLFGCAITSAQFINHKDENELSVSYGTFSLIQLLEGVHVGEYGYNEYQINTKLGPISVTYGYYLLPKISLGLTFVYEKESGDWYAQDYNQSINNPNNIGNFKRQVFTFAPELLYMYSESRDESIYFYGYFGIGESYLNGVNTYSDSYYRTLYYNGVNRLGNSLQAQNDKLEVAFQLSPICFSVGRKIRVFAELGFGYRGIINGGLMIKF